MRSRRRSRSTPTSKCDGGSTVPPSEQSPGTGSYRGDLPAQRREVYVLQSRLRRLELRRRRHLGQNSDDCLSAGQLGRDHWIVALVLRELGAFDGTRPNLSAKI